MNCPQCGEAVEAGAIFCGNCGHAMSATQPAPTQPTGAAPPAPASQPIAQVFPTGSTPPNQPLQAQPVPAAPGPQPMQPLAAAPQTVTPVSAYGPPSPIANAMQNSGGAPYGPGVQSGPFATPAMASAGAVPGYAVANPEQHKTETKAMIALILGILSIPGAIVPLVGLVLATSAFILAAISRPKLVKKRMATLAFVFAGIGLLATAAAFAYNFNTLRNQAAGNNSGETSGIAPADADAASGVSGKVADTACYSVVIPDFPTVDTVADSCSFEAYNKSSMTTSTDGLLVSAISNPEVTEAKLKQVGEQIADEYVASGYQGVKVASQGLGTVLDSPAYIIKANFDGGKIHMAVVLHPTAHGENVFIMVHATESGEADIAKFTKSWEWR